MGRWEERPFSPTGSLLEPASIEKGIYPQEKRSKRLESEARPPSNLQAAACFRPLSLGKMLCDDETFRS